MPFVDIDNLKTHYISKGRENKHKILFIHGSAGDCTLWEKQVHYFGKKYHALAIDLMGHGESEIDLDPSKISIKLYTDYVKNFLEALDIQKASMCGMSLGGGICIQFCLDYPEKTDCLGLANTGAKLGVNPKLLSALRKDFRGVMEKNVSNILGKETEGNKSNESMKEVSQINPKVGLADFEACNNFDSRKRITEIKKPTVIIGGSEDKMTPVWFQEYLHDKIENSTLEIIEGVGHESMVDKPKRFNKILSKFLEKYVG